MKYMFHIHIFYFLVFLRSVPVIYVPSSYVKSNIATCTKFNRTFQYKIQNMSLVKIEQKIKQYRKISYLRPQGQTADYAWNITGEEIFLKSYHGNKNTRINNLLIVKKNTFYKK